MCRQISPAVLAPSALTTSLDLAFSTSGIQMLSAFTVQKWLTEMPPLDPSGDWNLLSDPNQPQSRRVFETVFALQGGDGTGFNASVRVHFVLTPLPSRVPAHEERCETVVLTGMQGSTCSPPASGKRGGVGHTVILKPWLASWDPSSQTNVYTRLCQALMTDIHGKEGQS